MDRPNSILEVGIFQSEMGSMPQVGMLKALKLNAPEINSGVDTIYNGVTGKGQINIPDTKEFYTGEALYNG
jgi:hypothetical protein